MKLHEELCKLKIIFLALLQCHDTKHRVSILRKKSRYKSKYNNDLSRLKKLNANQHRQAISMANNGYIREFFSHIKQLKQTKLSPKQEKYFESIKREFVSL